MEANGTLHTLVLLLNGPDSLHFPLPNPIRYQTVRGSVCFSYTTQGQDGGSSDTRMAHNAGHSALLSHCGNFSHAKLWFLCMVYDIKARIVIYRIAFLSKGEKECIPILTWDNKLSGFVVKCVTNGVVGGNRVLVYPGVKSVLVMWHFQPLHLKTTIPPIHRSNQASLVSEFTNSTLACIKYNWVSIALVQVPYNSEASGTVCTVGETARNDDTWALHACDAARGIEGPTAGEHIPCKKKK